MKKLVLENGMEFLGEGFGYDQEVISELVFNTSMVGYQEVITDLSYTDQMVVMTYPLIGNYGICEEDNESQKVGVKALIVHEYNDKPSNYRYVKTLNDVLFEHQVAAIQGIDTRELTRVIRENGSMLAIICDESCSNEEALNKIKAYEIPHNQVLKAGCSKVWYSRCANAKYNVVAIDCGIKLNIVRQLNQLSCNVCIVPTTYGSEEILRMKPDGVFISNGPGDPEDNTAVIKTISELQGKIPMFGICLGHQMIAIANNLKTYKMKFGHRGGNHPVKNLLNGKVEITAQNHSYAVDGNSKCDDKVEFTHINLLDNTIEGLRIANEYCFSVQYHPESAPGPVDSNYLFVQFTELMDKFKKKQLAKGDNNHA